MRYIAVALAVLVSFAAWGFDVTAVMPATAGATQCQLYVDGSAAGGPRACGSSQSYPGLIANPGTYQFTYKALNASGESAMSPATTVDIAVVPPPEDPASPPSIVLSCDPSPCPATLTIVITP